MTVAMPITGNSIPGGGIASREAEYRGQGGEGCGWRYINDREVGGGGQLPSMLKVSGFILRGGGKVGREGCETRN